MGNFAPTQEQSAILDAFESPDAPHLIVSAGAGTGKTSTLKLLAESARKERHYGAYIAFNRTVADEAKRTFPSNIESRTAHSFAFRDLYDGRFGGRERSRGFRERFERTKNRRNDPQKLVNFLFGSTNVGFQFEYNKERYVFDRYRLARIVDNAATHWCTSARLEPNMSDLLIPFDLKVPRDDVIYRDLYEIVSEPLAKLAADLQDTDSDFHFGYAQVLKMWQLTDPDLDVDFVMLDEAQDASPVIADVFLKQADKSQIIAVGDENQAIYGFTGAVNAISLMKKSLPDAEHFQLTQSFRFNDAIAYAANYTLLVKDEYPDMMIEGSAPHDSVLEEPHLTVGERLDRVADGFDAVLVRTNAQAIEVILEAINLGLHPATTIDVRALKTTVNDLEFLRQGKRGKIKDETLARFATYAEFEEAIEEDSDLAAEYGTILGLIRRYEATTLLNALEYAGSISAQDASLVVSTAHKAKGLEWDNVLLYGFKNLTSREELMLLYVAITRARVRLEPLGLWALAHYGVPLSPRAIDLKSLLVLGFALSQDPARLTPEQALAQYAKEQDITIHERFASYFAAMVINLYEASGNPEDPLYEVLSSQGLARKVVTAPATTTAPAPVISADVESVPGEVKPASADLDSDSDPVLSGPTDQLF